MKPRKQGRPKTVGKEGEPRKVSLLLTPTQFRKLQARAKREGMTVYNSCKGWPAPDKFVITF